MAETTPETDRPAAEPTSTPAPDSSSAPSATPPAPDPHETQANLIIGAGVAATAAMGWLPAFIDAGWLVIANGGMVTALTSVYGFKWTGDHTRQFIERLIADSGITIMAVKGLSALMDLTGIGLPVGIALNGTLNAGITLAIGKAAQHYFKNAGNVADDDLMEFFKKTLRDTLRSVGINRD